MGNADAPASARVKAATALLSRAYGRPPALESKARVETDAEAKARQQANAARYLEEVAEQVAAGDMFGVSLGEIAKARAMFPDRFR